MVDIPALMSCRISAIFCPFPSMLSWLEAIATGVHRCSFGWDAEGPDIEIEWRYNRLSISQPEDCYGKDGKKTWYQRELFVDANRRQVVAAFYTAFRRFAESSECQPARYEDDLRGDEWTSLRIGKRLSPDELIGFLVGQKAESVEFFMCWSGLNPSVARCRSRPWTVPNQEMLLRTFNGILPEAEIERHLKQLLIEGEPPVHRFVPAAWERMDASRRKDHLREMLRWPIGYRSGSPLRTLRSERIESYLREPAVQQPKKSTMVNLFEVAPPPPEKPAAFEPAVKLRKVISGGQTGADRAALDWAIERGYEHGGRCPRGRRAEDGCEPCAAGFQPQGAFDRNSLAVPLTSVVFRVDEHGLISSILIITVAPAPATAIRSGLYPGAVEDVRERPRGFIRPAEDYRGLRFVFFLLNGKIGLDKQMSITADAMLPAFPGADCRVLISDQMSRDEHRELDKTQFNGFPSVVVYWRDEAIFRQQGLISTDALTDAIRDATKMYVAY